MLKNTELGLYALSFNAKMPKTFVESNNAQGRFSVERHLWSQIMHKADFLWSMQDA
jgi:hypothetical protein